MSSDSTDGQTSGDQGTSQDAQGGGDRAAARAAQGLPASFDDLTAEQLHTILGEATIEVESGGGEQVEVLAMQDGENTSGEAVA